MTPNIQLSPSHREIIQGGCGIIPVGVLKTIRRGYIFTLIFKTHNLTLTLKNILSKLAQWYIMESPQDKKQDNNCVFGRSLVFS